MIDTKDLYWLAGLLEGEGSFHSTKATWNLNRSLIIKLAMVDGDIVRRAYEITRFGNLRGPFSNGPGRQDYWNWTVGRRIEVIQLCMTLYPLMGERRKVQIRSLIQIWRDIP